MTPGRINADCLKEVCYYNSAIVFDKNGQILAQYNKFHVYEKPYIDSPPSAKAVTFKTDFGARFGLMICFDINYSEPGQELLSKKVDAILYQAAWTNELPFLTGKYQFIEYIFLS